jgi:hypothetical protein
MYTHMYPCIAACMALAAATGVLWRPGRRSSGRSGGCGRPAAAWCWSPTTARSWRPSPPPCWSWTGTGCTSTPLAAAAATPASVRRVQTLTVGPQRLLTPRSLAAPAGTCRHPVLHWLAPAASCCADQKCCGFGNLTLSPCVNGRLERRGGMQQQRRQQMRAPCCARSQSGCPGSPRLGRCPRALWPSGVCVGLGPQRQHDEHSTSRLDWLQAKSKSRQDNYFSLLAKSRSGPARDISVDFGSSTGLMSRQARGGRAVGTDAGFHHRHRQSLCSLPPYPFGNQASCGRCSQGKKVLVLEDCSAHVGGKEVIRWCR